MNILNRASPEILTNKSVKSHFIPSASPVISLLDYILLPCFPCSSHYSARLLQVCDA